jgi:hypothetical protein
VTKWWFELNKHAGAVTVPAPPDMSPQKHFRPRLATIRESERFLLVIRDLDPGDESPGLQSAAIDTVVFTDVQLPIAGKSSPRSQFWGTRTVLRPDPE